MIERDVSHGILVETLYQMEDVLFSLTFQKYFSQKQKKTIHMEPHYPTRTTCFCFRVKVTCQCCRTSSISLGETVVPASCPLPITFFFLFEDFPAVYFNITCCSSWRPFPQHLLSTGDGDGKVEYMLLDMTPESLWWHFTC